MMRCTFANCETKSKTKGVTSNSLTLKYLLLLINHSFQANKTRLVNGDMSQFDGIPAAPVVSLRCIYY